MCMLDTIEFRKIIDAIHNSTNVKFKSEVMSHKTRGFGSFGGGLDDLV